MDWWATLDPGVRQGLVVVGAALVGALFVLVAQLLAARKATKTALSLFDQQTAEHRRITETSARDRRERAQIAERQQAYARFMSFAWQYERATTDLRTARRELANLESLREAGEAAPEHAHDKEQAVSTAAAQQSQVRDDLSQAREVVRLLSPAEVRYAADRWFLDLVRGEAAGAQRAKSDFLAHARVDIGADKPARPDEDRRPL
jgi:hypothetical protein